MRASIRGRDAESGAAAVEFALIVTLLLVLVFGIIEFGLAFNRSQGMHAAAREGARIAAIGRDAQTVGDAAVQAAAQTTIATEDVQGEIETLDTSGGVTATWQFQGTASGGASVTSGSGSASACDGSSGAERVRVAVQVQDPAKYAIDFRVVPISPIEQPFMSEGVFRCEP